MESINENADKWRYYSRFEFGNKAIWYKNYEQYMTIESVKNSRYYKYN